MTQYRSWGGIPNLSQRAIQLSWIEPQSLVDLHTANQEMLPRGLGRSYGDSCLVRKQSVLLDLTEMDRLLALDTSSGVVRCQAGMGFHDLLRVIVPLGWFLPVTPGTKYLTVGGAVANDVHGKNHHRRGSFGHSVLRLKLIRTDGECLICSPFENAQMFAATIGGLGLTGVIEWVEFALIPIQSSMLDVEIIPFSGLSEYLELAQESESFEYTVSWIDCLSSGPKMGRGLFLRGDHSASCRSLELHRETANMPFDLPSFILNKFTIRAFNALYYRKTLLKRKSIVQHYDPFFYPLDVIGNSNRIYGRRGFFQYQFVVSPDLAKSTVEAALKIISKAGQSSFLSVLKDFGNLPSRGLLSFPREGTTLALDIPNKGTSTLKMMNDLDKLILEAGGAVYPAKDARMSAEIFRQSFPKLETFLKLRDPGLNSHFFSRVTGGSR